MVWCDIEYEFFCEPCPVYIEGNVDQLLREHLFSIGIKFHLDHLVFSGENHIICQILNQNKVSPSKIRKADIRRGESEQWLTHLNKTFIFARFIQQREIMAVNCYKFSIMSFLQ